MKAKFKEWATQETKIKQHLAVKRNRYVLLDCTNPQFKQVIKKNERAFAELVGNGVISPTYSSDGTRCYMRSFIALRSDAILDHDFDPKSLDRERWFADIEKKDILRTMHLSKQ